MSAFLMPAVFVLIWSTGWIVAKYAAPHADPLAFLTLRYVGAVAVLAPMAVLSGARWPRSGRDWAAAAVNGALLHGIYLGGVWWAISHGVPAGVSALIAALQPLFTALAAGPLVGERLDARRWLGIAVGFIGVAAVVAPKLSGAGAIAGAALPIAINVLAMVAVTAATLHQKRSLAGADPRMLAIGQYVGALVVTVPVVALLGEWRFDATLPAFGALAWSVVVLSVIAILLMLVMIERGEVSRVAALIYLVPPVAAVQAYLLFGETLSTVQLIGMALAALGVALAGGGSPPAASAEGCIAARPPDGEDETKTPRRPA